MKEDETTITEKFLQQDEEITHLSSLQFTLWRERFFHLRESHESPLQNDRSCRPVSREEKLLQ